MWCVCRGVWGHFSPVSSVHMNILVCVHACILLSRHVRMHGLPPYTDVCVMFVFASSLHTQISVCWPRSHTHRWTYLEDKITSAHICTSIQHMKSHKYSVSTCKCSKTYRKHAPDVSVPSSGILAYACAYIPSAFQEINRNISASFDCIIHASSRRNDSQRMTCWEAAILDTGWCTPAYRNMLMTCWEAAILEEYAHSERREHKLHFTVEHSQTNTRQLHRFHLFFNYASTSVSVMHSNQQASSGFVIPGMNTESLLPESQKH